MIQSLRAWLFASALLVPLCTFAQDPGTAESVGAEAVLSSSSQRGGTSLSPFFNLTGTLTLSLDGTGIATPTGTIDVDKPAGATVIRAFLFTAQVPGPALADGAVSLDGTSISYDDIVTGMLFAPVSVGRADVTSIVASVVDPAAPGIVSVDYSEAASSNTDGSVLAVVFDDPAAETNTVSLLFGVQSPAGDNFSVALASPFDDDETDIQLSLGISFGFQSAPSTNQSSIIEVNGTRLTSSAGGYDDCAVYGVGTCFNGQLITVGGIGDDPANPPDPDQVDNDDDRYDDELYTLDPMIPDGATSINVFSQNPSNDDAVFFAGFQFFGAAAIVGEGILLGPVDSTNPINTNHTVTARVQDDDGDPVSGRNVDFEIISGPNVGLTGSDMTDASGEADFTWTSTVAGMDRVVARFIDSNGDEQTSNVARKTWTDGSGGECVFTAVNTNGLSVPSTGGQFRFRFTIDNSASASDANYTIWGVAVDGDGNLFHVRKRSAVNRDPMVPAGMVYTAGYNQRVHDYIPDGTYTYTIHAGTYDPSDPMETNGCGSETFVVTKGGTTPARPARPLPLSLLEDAWSNVEITAGEIAPAAMLEAVGESVLVGPNPSPGRVSFAFTLLADTEVSLVVFDVQGREVAVVAGRAMSSGPHAITLDHELPDGVYVWRLTAGDRTETGRLTVIR